MPTWVLKTARLTIYQNCCPLFVWRTGADTHSSDGHFANWKAITKQQPPIEQKNWATNCVADTEWVSERGLLFFSCTRRDEKSNLWTLLACRFHFNEASTITLVNACPSLLLVICRHRASINGRLALPVTLVIASSIVSQCSPHAWWWFLQEEYNLKDI